MPHHGFSDLRRGIFEHGDLVATPACMHTPQDQPRVDMMPITCCMRHSNTRLLGIVEQQSAGRLLQ
jgi:hypothetical protein